MPCYIDELLHFKCPSCGLTRAFRELSHFRVLASFKYNILAIPIFVFLVLITISMLIDVIFSKEYTEKIIKYLGKGYPVLLILVIVTTVINNIYL